MDDPQVPDLGTARVRDVPSGTTATAEVCQASAEQFCAAKRDWSSEFAARRGRGVCDEDALWWDVSIQPDGALVHTDVDAYVLVHHFRVEGVLLVDRLPRPARYHPEQLIRYVLYLATAPWNRRPTDHHSPLSRVGLCLLQTATHISIATGCRGWIGLHSLRQAESWYRQFGLSDFGCDPLHHGLRYFEGTALQDCPDQCIIQT